MNESKEHLQVKHDGTSVEVTVTVDRESVRQAEQKLLRTVRQHVRVPGFRPGKAPPHLALSRYGEDAFREDLREELVQEHLGHALREEALAPLTTPVVETLSFAPDAPFSFKATFEILPEIEIPDTPDLALPKEDKPEITEEELEGVLEDLRKRASVLQPKESGAEAGDVIRIRRGEQVWEAEVDPEGDVGAQLVGAQSGATITLRHEEATQEFVIEGVYQLIPPEPEEAARHFGQDSWEALREDVRDKLLAQATAEAEGRRRSAALDALADAVGLEPPPGFLSEVVDEEMKRFGAKPQLREEIEHAVRRRIRREILANLICKQKGLTPSQEDIEAQARESDEDPETVRGRWLLQRAADWILERGRSAS